MRKKNALLIITRNNYLKKDLESSFDEEYKNVLKNHF